ncbi:MAG: GGDEF domain-containing protein [Pseudomonadota bacterium]
MAKNTSSSPQDTHRVELCSAIDIFQGLNGAATTAVLFDAMLGLALDYNQGPDAYILVRDGHACRVAAQSEPSSSASDGSPDLPAALTLALAVYDASAPASVVHDSGKVTILVPLTGTTGHQHGFLCVIQADPPAPEALHTLTLIAACGATMLDNLTGLPNRHLLMDRLRQAIAMGERGNFVVALAFIDLDGLTEVNDVYGMAAGDLLLRTVGDRIIGCTRKCDTVARLEGGKFILITLHNTILAPSAPERPAGEGGYHSYVSDVLAKIVRVLAEPLMLAGEPYVATCSIGVGVYPQAGHDAETLLLHAEAAMYSAKRNGRNRIKFYAGDPLPG